MKRKQGLGWNEEAEIFFGVCCCALGMAAVLGREVCVWVMRAPGKGGALWSLLPLHSAGIGLYAPYFASHLMDIGPLRLIPLSQNSLHEDGMRERFARAFSPLG